VMVPRYALLVASVYAQLLVVHRNGVKPMRHALIRPQTLEYNVAALTLGMDLVMAVMYVVHLLMQLCHSATVISSVKIRPDKLSVFSMAAVAA
jgi:hypothetical protein